MTDGDNISRLYKQGGSEQPGADLDSLVLNAARDAVSEQKVPLQQDKTQNPQGPFSGGQRLYFSIASVIVITLVLVPIMQQQTSTVPMTVDDGLMPAAMDNAASSKPSPLLKSHNVQHEIAGMGGSPVAVEAIGMVAPVRTPPKKRMKAFSRAEKSASELMFTAPVTRRSMSEGRFITETSVTHAASASDSFAEDLSANNIMSAPQWLQKIRSLLAQGENERAQQELDRFVQRYPDIVIDSVMLNQLKKQLGKRLEKRPVAP